MEYQATAKYIRISPRKLRVVADSVRTLAPSEAVVQLTHMSRAGGKPLAAVIESAIANAKQKNVKEETLRFEKIEVMGGPSLKRWRAVSRGQAHAFKKRMTHVRIILTDQTDAKKSKRIKKEEKSEA